MIGHDRLRDLRERTLNFLAPFLGLAVVMLAFYIIKPARPSS